METCTWKACTDIGIISQKDSDDNEWANLCEWHDIILNSAVAVGKPKQILRGWVLASGGAKKLANKTTDSLFKGR